MNLYNLMVQIKMITDPAVWKQLFQIHQHYKKDPAYNLLKILKAAKQSGSGEKIVSFNNQYLLTPFIPPFPSRAFFYNMISGADPEKPFSDKIYTRRNAPISVHLSITSKCPYNCRYCSEKTGKKGRELSTDQWATIIKDLQNMGTSIIGFTGGEPLLRDDLERLIQTVDNRSTPVLFSSGYGFTPKRAKSLKKSGLFSIAISLDAVDKEIHNRNRSKKDAYDTALHALKISREAGFYTIAQSVITRDQLDQKKLFDLFKLAKKYGAHEMKLLEPIRCGKLTKAPSDQFFTPEDRQKLISIQRLANKKFYLPKITTFALTESAEKYGCGAGTQHSYINASGELYPCDFIPLPFGNCVTTPVEKLWKGMNRIAGIPHRGCLAQKINPLSPQNPTPQDAIKLLSSYQSPEYPEIYKILHPKK